MITFTGFDYASFNYLQSKFMVLYLRYTPYSRNGKIVLRRSDNGIPRNRRPRHLDSRACLGLVLAFTRTRGSMYAMQMLFGITGSVLSLFLRFGRRLLIRVLKEEPGARVAMPSLAEIEQYKRIVSKQYPSLEDVWFVMDGLKLLLEKPGFHRIQSCFYNGWLHDHFVGNIFVFAPSGLIVCCSINNPGCVHDSLCADVGGVYEKLEEQYLLSGGKGVVDAAFARRRFPFLIKSCQVLPANAPQRVILVSQDATSLRQSAEWGMRALQGSFPRLKDRFHYEEFGERLLMLLTIVHLYNFRTRYIGLNHIRSTFMPQFERHEGNVVLDWANLV
jgi:hypothetical protein